MKFEVFDEWGETLETFCDKKSALAWLNRYCYHSGVNWIVYDLAHFPYKLTSRVIHLEEV